MAHLPGYTVAHAKELAKHQGTSYKETEQPTAPRENNTEDKRSAASAVPRSSKDLEGLVNCSCFTIRYISSLTLIIPRRSLNPTPIELGLN